MSEQIPDEVLYDYQNRTVVSVTNLVWNNAEQTVLTANVEFEELLTLGALPFTTNINSDTDHGVLIWNNAVAGLYGPIDLYVAPPLAFLRRTKKEFRSDLIANGIMPSAVSALILANEDEIERETALNAWDNSEYYDRHDPLIDQIGAMFGLSPEDIDAMWPTTAPPE